MSFNANAQHRPRRSLFAANTPTTDGAPDADAPEERQEWLGASDRQAAIERAVARREWYLTHGDMPLAGGWDSDGHAVLPADLLAERAAEADEAEAQRIADLTPARLDALQLRRWNAWFDEYQLHRPTYLRLALGPRAEMLARRDLVAWSFDDADPRHPDGGRVAVRGVSSVQTPPIEEQPRAYPNERVLDAIRQQLLIAFWLPEESNRPTPPTLPTFEARIAAAQAEREARAAAKRDPNYNWRLIVGGGRGW